MNIIVMNRDSIEKYIEDRKHIIISIYTPYDTRPNIPENKNRLEILSLQFHDWNERDKSHIEQNYPNSAEANRMIYFNNIMAESIIDFVKKNLDKIELIICHCDAGISRSAGCAAALSKCINGNDEYFFKKYLPNSLVYSTIIKEWYGQN